METTKAATAEEKIDPIIDKRKPTQLLKSQLCHDAIEKESMRPYARDIKTGELEKARMVLNPSREEPKCEIMGDF